MSTMKDIIGDYSSEDNPFPIETKDPSKKSKKEFGVKVAKAILAKHYYNVDTYDSFRSVDQIQENRRYATGEQDTHQYLRLLGVDDDSSYMNIDLSIHSPASAFVNRIIGDMMNQDFSMKANSMNAQAEVQKNKDRKKFLANMILSQASEEMEKQGAPPVVDKNEYIPEDPEDLEVYMDMNYKQAMEVATEKILNWEMYKNDFDSIKPKVIRDLVENNFGVMRTYFDSQQRPRLRYVNIANYITTHSDEGMFTDTDHEAEWRMMSIREIREMMVSDGWRSSKLEEELFYIAKKYSGNLGNAKWQFGEKYNPGHMYKGAQYNFDDHRIPVLDFVYYTWDKITYREKIKSGKTFFERKGMEWEPKEGEEKIQKEVEMAYKGYWIIGSEHVLNYGYAPNMLRPKQGSKMSDAVYRQFTAIKLEGRSNVEIIKPYLDNIQLTVLKMRNYMATAAPPGFNVDVSALHDISIGTDDNIDPLDVIKIRQQTGVGMYNGQDQAGDPRNRPPLEDAPNGLGRSLEPLIQNYQFELQNIRTDTGITPAKEGSEPSSDALVGVQKMQLLASNNATRELFESFRRLVSYSGVKLSRMIQDRIKFGKGIEEYKDIIGPMFAEHLNFAEDMYASDIGIEIESLPDADEVERFTNFLNAELKQGTIGTDDAMEVTRMRNVKLAEKYLKNKKAKNQREEMKRKQQEEQIVAQREQRTAQVNAQMDSKKKKEETEQEMRLEQLKHQQKMEELEMQHKNHLERIDREGHWKIEEIEEAGEESLDTTEGEGKRQPKVFPKGG